MAQGCGRPVATTTRDIARDPWPRQDEACYFTGAAAGQAFRDICDLAIASFVWPLAYVIHERHKALDLRSMEAK